MLVASKFSPASSTSATVEEAFLTQLYPECSVNSCVGEEINILRKRQIGKGQRKVSGIPVGSSRLKLVVSECKATVMMVASVFSMDW